jgi:hypothetical protein
MPMSASAISISPKEFMKAAMINQKSEHENEEIQAIIAPLRSTF